jgi:4-carboxymuconolactone decarboxylase
MTNEKYDQGMQARRAILGHDHVERATANQTDFDADFQRFITEAAWGTVWSNPDLNHHTRHLITIAILAALGREQELALHLRATQNTGVTPQELAQVLHHVAIYAGVPAANSAFSLAKKMYAELNQDPKNKE